MRRAGRWLMPLLLILFCLGVVYLWQLRFEIGDVYPEYSSLRSDPLGARALFEALEGTGVRAERSYRGLEDFADERGTAVLYLGWSPLGWRWTSEDRLQAWDAFVREGGRLILALSPLWQSSIGEALDEDGWVLPEDATVGEAGKLRGSVEQRWGFGLRFAPLGEVVPAPEQVSRVAPNRELPSELTWRTQVYFAADDAAWNVLYRRDEGPVLMWRRLGAGTLVLSSDSYLMSNEGLRLDRQPGLLAWLIGPADVVIFEEGHLGVLESPGVGTLIRRYRLGSVLVGLLVLAALYVWMSSSPLVPVARERPQDGPASGRHTAAGLGNLLRRNIPSDRVLAACWSAWVESLPRQERASARVREAEQVIRRARDRRGDPTAAYQEAARILKRSPG
jgi:Domain of unknown function (DUF4350)